MINGDGLQTRDYVYVEDVVAANLLALNSASTGAVNIGTACETDVVTLLGLLAEKTGLNFAARHGPAKLGEQRRSSLDISSALRVLGWRPRTTLSAGLDKTVEYWRHA